MERNLQILEDSEERGNETWVVLRVQGEPRESNADQLEVSLRRQVSALGCRVLLRFESARHVDEAVIGVLMNSFVKARRVRGSFRVDFPDELRRHIRRLFGGGDDDWLAGETAPLLRPPDSRGGSLARPLPNEDD